MLKLPKTLYLASKSPRRKKLLKQIGFNFKTFSVDTIEEIIDGESPAKTVKRLAQEKMEAAEKKVRDGIILTADTIVVLNNQIIGKPKNKKSAFEILKRLSGNSHLVYTGFCVKSIPENKIITTYEKTTVQFRTLSDSEIKDYIDGGSPMDKAGAYGIQDDYGAVFVCKIVGCYYNVVGLPISKVFDTLKQFPDVRED